MRLKKFVKEIIHNKESYLVPEKCQVLGMIMYLQKNGNQYRGLARRGILEKETTGYFLKNVSEGDMVLDIGANIGYYTLIFAKLVGEKGKVFAFEPDPSNFEILKKNVTTNNFQNVILENVAVTNSTGTTELYLSTKDMGHHRIYKSKHMSKNHVSVKTIRLDDYLNSNSFLEKISFVKLDVEGSEFGSLKGMEKILSQNKRIELIMEFVPRHLRDYGTDPIEVLQYLKNLEFDFCTVDVKEFQHKFDDIEEIVKEFEVPAKNILCKKQP